MTLGYQGPDWAETVFPDAPNPKFHFGDAWPIGAGSGSAGGDKDALEDGDHAWVGVGPTGVNGILVGFTMTVNEETETFELQCHPNTGCLSRISNVSAYADQAPDTFLTSVVVGQIVYLDNSDSLPTNVTLSFSPLNDQGADNPVAGIVVRGQADYDDTGVGGADAVRTFPYAIADELTTVILPVMNIKSANVYTP